MTTWYLVDKQLPPVGVRVLIWLRWLPVIARLMVDGENFIINPLSETDQEEESERDILVIPVDGVPYWAEITPPPVISRV